MAREVTFRQYAAIRTFQSYRRILSEGLNLGNDL